MLIKLSLGVEDCIIKEANAYELKDSVLLEYIGRQDVNNQELYDGDIVLFDSLDNVISDNGHYIGFISRSEFNNNTWNITIEGLNFPLELCSKFKKIGNKYENPEILLNYFKVIDIYSCYRCQSYHRLTFKKLSNPVMDCTHFAICPETLDPILMKIHEV